MIRYWRGMFFLSAVGWLFLMAALLKSGGNYTNRIGNLEKRMEDRFSQIDANSSQIKTNAEQTDTLSNLIKITQKDLQQVEANQYRDRAKIEKLNNHKHKMFGGKVVY